MRGTLRVGLQLRHAGGIIPACAGNTDARRLHLQRRRDHPRVCGEHAGKGLTLSNYTGSSPRVRGTRRPRARARASSRDHPRVCGEHSPQRSQVYFVMGSSPRVRGTLVPKPITHFRRGIIPACAGNTFCLEPRFGRCWDHPRVCGEHHHVVQLVGVPQGSSPRVRGTPIWNGHVHLIQGIIPACAGNTLKNPSSKYHSD